MNRADHSTDAGERAAWMFGWLLAAAIMTAGYGAAALQQQFGDPDNAMRLVGVRDFLAGQGWFDTTQHRLNPPEGTPMHWARWVDLAIGAPIWALTPLIGQRAAEIAIGFAWPLGLLGAFMWLVTRVCVELADRDGLRGPAAMAGAVLAALAFPAMEKFAPGAFDHHNIQLVLVMAAVLGLMRMHAAPLAGLATGWAMGLALATAAEGAPFVAAGLLAAGVMWLFRPDAYGRALAWTGAGLAGSAGVLFLLEVPRSEWAAPVCDAMSTPFLGLAMIGGGIAATLGIGLPQVAKATIGRRVAAAAGLGAAGLAAMALLFPGCAGGGYSAVTAEMTALWMAQISETRSILQLAQDSPAQLAGAAGAALAGLVAAVVYLRKRWMHPDGWIVLAFLVAAWGIMSWQVRGASFATALAIPFGAWAAMQARRAFRLKPSGVRAAGFALAATGSAAAAWAGAGDLAQSRLSPASELGAYAARVENARACTAPRSIDALNGAPDGVMLNQFTLGAHIIQRTPHSVIAAAYHRNADGIMTAINALRSGEREARDIVLAAGADYVLVCPAAPETRFYMRHPANGADAQDTLSARLADGRAPDWLEPVALNDTPLKLYRVIR